MSDKYPGVSPYTYCANNPVRLVDPDGREKVDFTSQDAAHETVANYPENAGVIHLWTHGSPTHIEFFGGQLGTNENDIILFSMALEGLCPLYAANTKSHTTSILVMHSCETGGGNENENFAQALSSQLDLVVVAPTENVRVKQMTGTGYCEIGVYQKDKPDTENSLGSWNVYYKGKCLESISGQEQPIFDNPKEKIEYYEKLYKNLYENSSAKVD